MGNTGSQTSHSNQRTVPEEQWAHSFPRTQTHKLNQPKVLPDREVRIKLRPTNNGEILHSGGTLTGRQHAVRNIIEKNGGNNERTYLSNQRYSLHKLGYRANQHMQKNIANHKQQLKLFGSEPDLRISNTISPENEMKERRIKKKYKAPPPPNSRMNDSTKEWESSTSNDDFPRRVRLFKTRVETKKQNSSHVNTTLDRPEHSSTCKNTEESENSKLRPNRLSMPELKLAERIDFQREIKEATQRLKVVKNENTPTNKFNITESTVSDKEKLKTLDPNRDMFKKKLKQIVELEENNNIINAPHFTREEPSGKESSTPELSPTLKDKTRPKTFYFGMDDVGTYKKIHKECLHSSESDISSDLDLEESHVPTTDIDLQLRPILPKKQLAIPRFSPAAAWKLLSAVENSTGTIASDDLPVFIEEKIEKYARPPPPNIQIGHRSNHDKSGDSGISGDAGPVLFDDNIDIGFGQRNHPYFDRHDHISWTPQQDLGDDSSLEDLENDTPAYKGRPNLNRPHVFSLSLPRENQLAAYMIEKSGGQYTGLQKLKRSVSGVLSNLSNNKKDIALSNSNEEDGNNWFFSKSAPNSINNGFNSLEHRTSNDINDPVFSQQVSTNRVMYLPELKEHKLSEISQRRSRDETMSEKKYKLSVYSKSCEDLNMETRKQPETLQDPPQDFEFPWPQPFKKPKKFTFQSTVRQIERRRMAEKLSKEAEKKEQQRLRELEAMQKVEEEFQKKRAKEKANIRQQLRLCAMDDNNSMWNSLPPDIELKERQEPDGALSSTSSGSPPPQKEGMKISIKKDIKAYEKVKATQELSEFRQFQRDYKEFKGITKYSDNKFLKQTVVHPQITCNMPKAKGNKVVNGNYRKEFAYGVKYSRSVESTHSEDSQSNSPQMYHNKYSPITRF